MHLAQRERDGARYLAVESWEDEGLFHGFGDASLAVAPDLSDWARIFPEQKLLLLRQEHGKRIIELREGAVPERPPGDGWLSRTGAPQDCCLGILTADCFPVLLFSREHGVTAALHCGWRGVQLGLLVEVLVNLARTGVHARSIEVAIGPGAQNCCYEVGLDVKRALQEAFTMVNSPPISGIKDVVTMRGGRVTVSLRDLLFAQAVFCGIPPKQIVSTDHCTICNTRYTSYRREKDQAGRQLSFIGTSILSP